MPTPNSGTSTAAHPSAARAVPATRALEDSVDETPAAEPVPSRLLVVGEELAAQLTECAAKISPKPDIEVTTPTRSLTVLEQRDYLAAFIPLSDLGEDALAMLAAHTEMGVPVIAVISTDPSQRGVARSTVRAHGARDCVNAHELGPALLDAVLAHCHTIRETEVELVELRQRFSLAIRGSKDGMWEWDLRTSRVFFSERWRQMLRLEDQSIEETIETWLGRVHPQDASRVRTDLDAHISGRKSIHESEHRIRAGDGGYRWVLSRAAVHRDDTGTPIRIAGSLTDITPYRMREQDLREQSRHDSLTNLPRRDVLVERLARTVELARQYDDFAFALLLVHADRMSLIRDSYGQEAADTILALLAKRLLKCVRPDDLVCRFGPEKFALLLEDLDDANEGTLLADRIHKAMKDPFEVSGNKVFTSVSIGMTTSARSYDRVDEVITDVAAATDHARTQSQDRNEIFNTSMRIEALTLLRMEMSLREAIEQDEFQLYYQPIVKLDSRTMVGFEALMRWQHPRRGRVSPGEFIPVAESTGLIIPIGRWAIEEAARQVKEWNDEFELDGGLSVSVNLSGKQASDPQLLSDICAVLETTKVDPGCIKIELTETVLLDNAERVITLLQELRARGLKIWVDDFGTGYSSLSYLHRFPVDGLKIDRSFIEPLDGTKEAATMVRTILSLARNLGVDVVAEGIETEAQAEQLAALRCPYAQGYLFAKPLSPGEAYAAIARGNLG